MRSQIKAQQTSLRQQAGSRVPIDLLIKEFLRVLLLAYASAMGRRITPPPLSDPFKSQQKQSWVNIWTKPPCCLGPCMRTVNVHEAKTQFSRLIDVAHAGERKTASSIGCWRPRLSWRACTW